MSDFKFDVDYNFPFFAGQSFSLSGGKCHAVALDIIITVFTHSKTVTD